MVRAPGIEPGTPAWNAGVLPLNYARLGYLFLEISSNLEDENVFMQ